MSDGTFHAYYRFVCRFALASFSLPVQALRGLVKLYYDGPEETFEWTWGSIEWVFKPIADRPTIQD